MSAGKVFFIGGLRELELLMRFLQREFNGAKLYGYKLQNGNVVFGELASVSDLPLGVVDEQKPGYYRLLQGFRFRHCMDSPKRFLLPPEHLLVTISSSYDVIKVEDDVEPVILFGIKPCDLKAIEILDRIIYGRNPVYTKRRDSVKAVVVEECLEPGETCFCAAVNSGPTASRGFDIAYARLRQDLFIFRYGSPLGEKILSRIGLREASEEHVKKYLELVDKARALMMARIPPIKDIGELLRKRASDKKFWEDESMNCVGCGNCNYVCPTCFCIEIDDRVEGNVSRRVAIWAGCRTYTYGLVAGGHFRRDLYTRYRHFILHKFVFYPIQVGDVGCVGCGRCITWCPMGIDMRDTLKHLTEVRG